MFRSRTVKFVVMTAGIFMVLASASYAQTVDTVRSVNQIRHLTDSTIVNTMPEAMPYAISMQGKGADIDVNQDTTFVSQGIQSPSRKEMRQARKAAKKAPIALPSQSAESFRVTGGRRIEDARPARDSLLAGGLPDSLSDGRSLQTGIAELRDSLGNITDPQKDSLLRIAAMEHGDTAAILTGIIDRSEMPDSMTRRERKIWEKQRMRADSTLYRHSPFFKDTMSISKVSLFSLFVPGFGQFYNGDYWKIPVLYGVTAATAYMGFYENKQYKKQKKIYDYRIENDFPREFVDPVQTNMIKHNTMRQLWFLGALGTYIYFIADGAINYPSTETRIKTATTLSTICPGLGQMYNRSYWRVPIIVGGFATFVYVIDWNNRIYQRYKKAFELETQGKPHELSGIPQATIQSRKDSARRSRDFAIILTAAFYALNIIDAHVDAHLKDYDVSDDLSFRLKLEPTFNNLFTQTRGNTNWFGFNLSYTF